MPSKDIMIAKLMLLNWSMSMCRKYIQPIEIFLYRFNDLYSKNAPPDTFEISEKVREYVQHFSKELAESVIICTTID